MNKLQLFVRGYYIFDDSSKSSKFPSSCIEMLDDKISDEIGALLRNATPLKHNIMEYLNILELEKIMSQRNRISPATLTDFIKRNPNTLNNLNFFIVFELIHFIRDSKEEYDELLEILYAWIESKITSLSCKAMSDTESVLTFLEMMSCPWIESTIKKSYSTRILGNDANKIVLFFERNKNLFIQWHGFKLNEALRHINTTEVY